ncbi:aminotransferase class IV [Dysgonomonas sp. ZJ279]|uniref:aminotransferase class IV n=1 Tax=Dysgonomonas sp. ZJ279 TaxID=2709796 RepID=UPI0013EB5FF5|nr:aminotransferase class IV [Dysgonomonas sp. ZJ279]
MSRLTFIETIKVLDGVYYNLPSHIDRIRQTMQLFFNITTDINSLFLSVPVKFQKGLVKCRIVYSNKTAIISFEPYIFQNIRSLYLIEDDQIDYSYKSTDRGNLKKLLLKKGEMDEVLIIKNGLVTDTSYSNVVFENESGLYTPDSYLLNGTKRQLLLQKGVIKEIRIRVEDIPLYDKVYLINAMMDIEDSVCVSSDNIFYNNKKSIIRVG